MVGRRLSAVLPSMRLDWPRRRRVAWAASLLPLTAAYLGTGGGAWWALPVALGTAIPAGVLLASYVPLPGSGRRLDVGCTPCAAVSWTAVLGSLVMRSLGPGDPGLALVAALIVALGLAQRLSGATGCALPR